MSKYLNLDAAILEYFFFFSIFSYISAPAQFILIYSQQTHSCAEFSSNPNLQEVIFPQVPENK